MKLLSSVATTRSLPVQNLINPPTGVALFYIYSNRTTRKDTFSSLFLNEEFRFFEGIRSVGHGQGKRRGSFKRRKRPFGPGISLYRGEPPLFTRCVGSRPARATTVSRAELQGRCDAQLFMTVNREPSWNTSIAHDSHASTTKTYRRQGRKRGFILDVRGSRRDHVTCILHGKIFIILDNFVYHVGYDAIRGSFYSPIIKGRLVIVALQRRLNNYRRYQTSVKMMPRQARLLFPGRNRISEIKKSLAS